jgi:hypothetical protein
VTARAGGEAAAITEAARTSMFTAPGAAFTALDNALAKGRTLGDALAVADAATDFVKVAHSSAGYQQQLDKQVPAAQAVILRAVEQAGSLARTPAEVAAVLERTGHLTLDSLRGDGKRLAWLPGYKLAVESLLERAGAMVKTQDDARRVAQLMIKHDHRDRFGGATAALMKRLTPDQNVKLVDFAMQNRGEEASRRLLASTPGLSEVDRLALDARIERQFPKRVPEQAPKVYGSPSPFMTNRP